MDMEPKRWEQVKLMIRKYKAATALKADLVEDRSRGQGHVVNNMSQAKRDLQAVILGNKGKSMTKTTDEATKHHRVEEGSHPKAK